MPMRKFESGRQIRIGVVLASAILAALAAFYGAGGLVSWWTALMAVLVVGLFLTTLWMSVRMRRQREGHLRYHALYDSLTNLPNRSLFVDYTERALLRVARKSGLVAVLLVDLDNFEEINHSLGHEAGDRLLYCGRTA